MTRKILLTSFNTWLPHQTSNSSDDLLSEIAHYNFLYLSLTLVRQLPVDVHLSSFCVTAKINEIQPDGIICCGMAESRTKLSVETNAACKDAVLKTSVDLEQLLAGSSEIEISHDAGKFVCEGLYYSVLKYLSDRQMNSRCIFVHVPILTQHNLSQIKANFLLIIRRLLDL